MIIIHYFKKRIIVYIAYCGLIERKKTNISDHLAKKTRRNTSSSRPVREQKMKLPSGPSFAVAILLFGTRGGEGRVKERE